MKTWRKKAGFCVHVAELERESERIVIIDAWQEQHDWGHSLPLGISSWLRRREKKSNLDCSCSSLLDIKYIFFNVGNLFLRVANLSH